MSTNANAKKEIDYECEVSSSMIKDRIYACRLRMVKYHPFYSSLALRLEYKEVTTLPTAAVDGKSFFYNKHFINALDDSELLFLMAHAPQVSVDGKTFFYNKNFINALDDSELPFLMAHASQVDEDVRHKFKAHYDAMALPDPYEVVRGGVKEHNIKKTSMKYACSLNVMYALREVINTRKEEAKDGSEFTDEEYAGYVDNVIRFLIKNIDEKDIIISAIWMATDEDYGIEIHNAPITYELINDPDYDNFFDAMNGM